MRAHSELRICTVSTRGLKPVHAPVAGDPQCSKKKQGWIWGNRTLWLEFWLLSAKFMCQSLRLQPTMSRDHVSSCVLSIGHPFFPNGGQLPPSLLGTSMTEDLFSLSNNLGGTSTAWEAGGGERDT